MRFLIYSIGIFLLALPIGCSRSYDTLPQDIYPTSTSAGDAITPSRPLLPNSGCPDPSAPKHVSLTGSIHHGNAPVVALCTTALVADLVRSVGGEHVVVHQLMGDGADPHQFIVSAGDVNALHQCDIVFYCGLGLESKLNEFFTRLYPQKPVCPVTQYVPEQKLIHTADGNYDPHVWWDALLWKYAVDVVRDALVAYDPAHADDYRTRAEEYSKQLDAADATAREKLASIPPERRRLLTSHDAFRYFGRAYDFEVCAVGGVSTTAQPSVRQIGQLAQFVRQNQIAVAFDETSDCDRDLQSLIEGAKNRGQPVRLGGALFSDALSQSGSIDCNYLGAFNHNVDTIVDALK